ncbi:hypothetical protein DPMN_048260 [Dreissena polymorpha]|uniref:Uncharacterized protein n=1 Tax=Dreissena polymorpha TaxID=45954 RepID=A0A9D4HZZ0_DREPO|nr:hypothetical protein DPMN_048260 [Dreissena polymorpha]
MMEETAITSPEPVLIRVMAIMVRISTLPMPPSNRSAMNGVTRPVSETKSMSFG